MLKANIEDALAQCSLHSKNEDTILVQENVLHDEQTVNETKLDSQVSGSQNHPQTINLNDIETSCMESYNSAGNLQLQALIKEEPPSEGVFQVEAIINEEAPREGDDISKASTVSFEQYLQLQQILSKMSNQVASLRSGINTLLQCGNATNTSTTINSCDNCFHCNRTLMDAFRLEDFPKITNEAELKAFEQKLKDKQFAIKAASCCQIILSIQRSRKKIKKVCRQLLQAIFYKEFWSQTSWLRTTDEGVVKFALSKHYQFLKFFKTVVQNVINENPGAAFFSSFFKHHLQKLSRSEKRKKLLKALKAEKKAIRNLRKQKQNQEEVEEKEDFDAN